MSEEKTKKVNFGTTVIDLSEKSVKKVVEQVAGLDDDSLVAAYRGVTQDTGARDRSAMIAVVELATKRAWYKEYGKEEPTSLEGQLAAAINEANASVPNLGEVAGGRRPSVDTVVELAVKEGKTDREDVLDAVKGFLGDAQDKMVIKDRIVLGILGGESSAETVAAVHAQFPEKAKTTEKDIAYYRSHLRKLGVNLPDARKERSAAAAEAQAAEDGEVSKPKKGKGKKKATTSQEAIAAAEAVRAAAGE